VLGIEALLEILAASGVRYIFGNPGSTELSLNDALVGDSRFEYILGLHELPVTAMADNYARRLGVACVHISPGLGNAMGMLFNSYCSVTVSPAAPRFVELCSASGFPEPRLSGRE
jgi:benzoylformate decarboxylase